jgi:4'-phosphopantetheinyl transferase
VTDVNEIFWLEQLAADVPDDDGWLSPAERTRLGQLRFPKRRTDWRLGRWTAKRAIAAFFHFSLSSSGLAQVEIRSAPSGAPQAFIGNQPAQIVISLSHRDGVAACAVGECTALGCDLEVIEPRSSAFIADYFTGDEQAFVLSDPSDERDLKATLLWSAKESVLKALRTGLREDTRRVTVAMEAMQNQPMRPQPAAQYWHFLQTRHFERVFCGWWKAEGNLVRTVVADPPPLPPSLFEVDRTTATKFSAAANLGQNAPIVYSRNR